MTKPGMRRASGFDGRLVEWARMVSRRRAGWPLLWLFTDAERVPDPLPAIARLPMGISGVVFRHDGVADRAALARRIAALCRERRLKLTIAGDWRLAAALGAGVHLRGGRGRLPPRRIGGVTTASAHSVAELRRGRLSGALVFLSPAFATASHPGAPPLGPWRWSRLAGRHGAAALGGVTGASIGRLGPGCIAVGSIGALGALPK